MKQFTKQNLRKVQKGKWNKSIDPIPIAKLLHLLLILRLTRPALRNPKRRAKSSYQRWRSRPPCDAVSTLRIRVTHQFTGSADRRQVRIPISYLISSVPFRSLRPQPSRHLHLRPSGTIQGPDLHGGCGCLWCEPIGEGRAPSVSSVTSCLLGWLAVLQRCLPFGHAFAGLIACCCCFCCGSRGDS